MEEALHMELHVRKKDHTESGWNGRQCLLDTWMAAWLVGSSHAGLPRPHMPAAKQKCT